MIRSSILFILVIFIAHLSIAQQSFTAKAETLKVLQGSYFSVEFTLKNIEANNIEAPDFEGFNVIQGPIRESSFKSINGATTRSLTFRYMLEASDHGVKIIKPAKVKLRNAGELKTNPLKIRVVKRSQKDKANTDNLFAKMTISDSTAVVGQQLFLYYTLYHSVQKPIREFELRREDKFTKFDASNVVNSSSAQREIIDGKEYYVQQIAVRLLVPTDSGIYNISPAQINAYYEGGSRSRFGFRRANAVPLITNALQVNIIPFPLQSRPADFSGAIGKYKITTEINKTTTAVDDAVSLKVTIAGDGKPENVIAPRFESTSSLEIYDPQLISEKSYNKNNKILHYKLYEYLLVPKQTGTIEYRPILQIYDTEIDSFIALQGKNHKIRVARSSNSSTAVTTEDMASDLAPIIESTVFSKNKKTFFGSIVHWLLLGLLSFIVLLAYLYNSWQKNKAPIDMDRRRYDQASKIAIQKLEKALSLKSQSNSKGFYEEINKALLSYIANKLNIDTADLNKQNLADRLQQLDITTDTSKAFLTVLGDVELALFSGQKDPGKLDAVYTNALEAISQTEKQINT